MTSGDRRRADVHADHVDEAGDGERCERERQPPRQPEDDHRRRRRSRRRRAASARRGAWSGRRARSTPAASAPTDGAVRSAPSPIGPMWRIVRANTGASAIESPSRTAKRSRRDRAEQHARAEHEVDAGDEARPVRRRLGRRAARARSGQGEDRDERDDEERGRRRVDRQRLDGEDDAAERGADDDADLPRDAAQRERSLEQLARDELRRERARRRAADGGRDARRARRS